MVHPSNPALQTQIKAYNDAQMAKIAGQQAAAARRQADAAESLARTARWESDRTFIKDIFGTRK